MKKQFLFWIISCLCGIACSKHLLNETPSTSLTEPQTQEALWMLLDNENSMDLTPVLGEASADDYYFTAGFYAERSTLEKNTYRWADDLYEGANNIYDWNIPYQQVYTCNVVLNVLSHVSPGTSYPLYHQLKATALFKRSWAFFQLTQLFTPPYDSATEQQPMGIPLKLSADIQSPTTRSTIRQTYAQMLSDVKEAASLPNLPDQPDSRRNRPCRAAMFALLSRIYLAMHQYAAAGSYADSSLQLHNTLIDYNTISLTATTPFKVTNNENLYTSKTLTTIFQCILPNTGQANIDSGLYQSYSTYDLRRQIFFNTTSGYPRRKHFYDATANALYTGLATDEMYLTLAECLARTGKPTNALDYLNRLLQTRYSQGRFTPLAVTDSTTTLQLVLAERRKELVMRGTRWGDLRRLTPQEIRVTPARVINDTTVSLTPGSSACVLPIPPDVISASGIAQNKR